MRGGAFHNRIVGDAREVFRNRGWQVFTEYRYQSEDVVTYFDIFAKKDQRAIACEVETTIRHLKENAIKARRAGVDLWIIVPTRRLLEQSKRRLGLLGPGISILLPDRLERKLIKYHRMYMKGGDRAN